MRAIRRGRDLIRDFLASEAACGLVLMAAAALALIVANSPLSVAYFDALHAYLGPLSLHHWVRDALMAFFFLLVVQGYSRQRLANHAKTAAALKLMALTPEESRRGYVCFVRPPSVRRMTAQGAEASRLRRCRPHQPLARSPLRLLSGRS